MTQHSQNGEGVEARAREVLALEYEATAPMGKYVAMDIRRGAGDPGAERAIRAMIAFADEARQSLAREPATADAGREARAREVLALEYEREGLSGRSTRSNPDYVQRIAVRAMLAFANEATRPPAQAGAASVEVLNHGEVARIISDLLQQVQPDCPDICDRIIRGNEAVRAIIALASRPRATPTPAASGEIPGGTDAIEAGKIVLEGRGDGTYDEAEDAIRKLIAALSRAAPSSGPIAWCSPGQLANLTDVDADGGVYLPIRKTKRGNFTMPLYAAPSSEPAIAEGEREGFALMPARATREMVDAADACTDAYEAYGKMVEVGRVR